MTTDREGWRKDKSVNLAVILTIVITVASGLTAQALYATWWASKIDAAVATMAADATRLSGRVAALESDRAGDRITRLEADRTSVNASMAALQAAVGAIQTMVARIDERTGYMTDTRRDVRK